MKRQQKALKLISARTQGRQAVGARGPNIKFPKFSRAAVLVLVTFE